MTMGTGYAPADHPLRAALSNEMHVRKLPPLAAPARLMQFVMLSDNITVTREREAVAALCGLEPEQVGETNFISAAFGPLQVIWERHTEFSSYMFIRPGGFEAPFDPKAFAALPSAWIGALPGQVVRATQLAFAKSRALEDLGDHFSEQDLVVCDVADGAARLWSDFRLHDDGFGRLLLVDHGLTGPEAALVVQRLQELGNYRNMALLGLPVAQRLTLRVSTYEAELAELSAAIASGLVEDAELLRRLSALSANLAGLVAETRYRMSASRAYAAITQDRLQSLRVGRVKGHQTLADFTERRLLPAVRTCISFSARLEDLSQRLAWTSSLLRTRVDTALSRQNRDLLASMDRRTDLQLRLQQTVEGLSVFAISYYAVGLFSYATQGLDLARLGLSHDHLVAVAAPLAILCAWLIMRRLRRRLDR